MWIWIVLVGILPLYFVFGLRKKKKDHPLLKPDYKQDLVYLVQLPASPIIRSHSPYALKLETYLRLKKVLYEPVYSLSTSKKGLTPYIELNGEHIPDSNVIINELEKRGIAKPDGRMTVGQKAVSHLITVTIENHTSFAGAYWRYVYHIPEFYEKVIKPYSKGYFMDLLFIYITPYYVALKAKFHGIGRHTLDEIAEFSFQDLQALSNILSDQPFF